MRKQPSAPTAPDLSTAAGIAAHAALLVAGDRDRQHGSKLTNFLNIATLWGAYLEMRFDISSDALLPDDVAMMMVLLKMARTQSGALNTDDYVDMAGYAACAGEVAQSAMK